MFARGRHRLCATAADAGRHYGHARRQHGSLVGWLRGDRPTFGVNRRDILAVLPWGSNASSHCFATFHLHNRRREIRDDDTRFPIIQPPMTREKQIFAMLFHRRLQRQIRASPSGIISMPPWHQSIKAVATFACARKIKYTLYNKALLRRACLEIYRLWAGSHSKAWIIFWLLANMARHLRLHWSDERRFLQHRNAATSMYEASTYNVVYKHADAWKPIWYMKYWYEAFPAESVDEPSQNLRRSGISKHWRAAFWRKAWIAQNAAMTGGAHA